MASPMRSPPSVGMPPSPEATTASILGASSAGWSPQRPSSKRMPLGEALFPTEGDSMQSAHRSPQKERQSFGQLRSHNFVSNSVFTRGGDAPNSMSPPESPSRSGLGSVARGVPLPRPNSGFTPRKISNDRSMPSHHSRQHSDAENSEPEGNQAISYQSRKSKGVEILQKGSYVSNSPFRQAGNGGQWQEETKPLRPHNAWAMSAAAAAARNPARLSSSPPRSTSGVPSTPTTPERSTRPAISGSPRSRESTPKNSPSRSSVSHETNGVRGSPSGRGLLVSNRLHGPRVMEHSGPLEEGQAQDQKLAGPKSARHERRKTVTFDEVLEVQEFDKESSFDRESTRSEGDTGPPSLIGSDDADDDHNSGNSDEMWNRISGGGGASSDHSDPFTTAHDSPDRSNASFGLPSPSRSEPNNLSVDCSPSRQAHSMEYEAGDASTASLGGLDNAIHRVDSMVDELLLNEFLHDPPNQERKQTPDGSPVRPVHGDIIDSGSRAATLTTRKALPDLPGVATQSQVEVRSALSAPTASSDSGLPDLPQLSPLLMARELSLSLDGDEAPTVPQEFSLQPSASPAQRSAPPAQAHESPRRPGGRPHISRDAVLERVAREKSRASESPVPSAIPFSQTQTEMSPRVSERSTRKGRMSDSVAHIDPHSFNNSERPMLPPRADSTVVEARRAAPPSPVRDVDMVGGVKEKAASPLERLEAEVAAEQSQYADTPPPLPPKTEQPEEKWFTRGGSVERDITPTPAVSLQPARAATHDGSRTFPSALAPPPPLVTPAQQADAIIARRRSKNNGKSGRPTRRRSLSTNDATTPDRPQPQTTGLRKNASGEDDGGDVDADEVDEIEATPARLQTRESIGADLARSKVALDVSLQRAIGSGFTSTLEREISKIYKQGEHEYKVLDRGTFTSSDDKVTHSTSAGDVDSGKAWRKLRRPSDVNEYAKELREYRSNTNSKKALGKLFVMVDSYQPANLPPTSRATKFYCVLDNGLHMVKTGTASLLPSGSACRVGQEFELIQHKNLEFSLTLMVQRDAHLVETTPLSRPGSLLMGMPSSPKKDKTSPSISKGMSRFFTSPKKAAKREREASEELAQSVRNIEPLLAYVNREGAFGRANVVFEKVVSQCLAKCAILELPVMGVADPVTNLSGPANQFFGSTNASRADFARNLQQPRGTLRLKLFYLPPTTSIPRNLLPESLEECTKGMKAAEWHHADPSMNGTLTQLGGDCQSWRRRPVKIQGVHLICFNEITNKATVKIDLSKVISVEETEDPLRRSPTRPGSARSPSRIGTSAADEDELDETYHVERSFRVFFKDGERISFFADTDELKDQWINAIRKVIESEVPACPLWAQLAWEATHTTKQVATSVEGRPSNAGTEAPAGPPRSASSGMASGIPRSASRTPSTSSSLAAVAEVNTPERIRPTSMLPTPSSVSSRVTMPRNSNQTNGLSGPSQANGSSTNPRERPQSAMPAARMPLPGQHVSFSGIPTAATPSRKPVPGAGHQHAGSLPANLARPRPASVAVPPRR